MNAMHIQKNMVFRNNNNEFLVLGNKSSKQNPKSVICLIFFPHYFLPNTKEKNIEGYAFTSLVHFFFF